MKRKSRISVYDPKPPMDNPSDGCVHPTDSGLQLVETPYIGDGKTTAYDVFNRHRQPPSLVASYDDKYKADAICRYQIIMAFDALKSARVLLFRRTTGLLSGVSNHQYVAILRIMYPELPRDALAAIVVMGVHAIYMRSFQATIAALFGATSIHMSTAAMSFCHLYFSSSVVGIGRVGGRTCLDLICERADHTTASMVHCLKGQAERYGALNRPAVDCLVRLGLGVKKTVLFPPKKGEIMGRYYKKFVPHAFGAETVGDYYRVDENGQRVVVPLEHVTSTGKRRRILPTIAAMAESESETWE